MNRFCAICTTGSNVASFARSCLSYLPTPSFRRLGDDIRWLARQSLPNLETIPSADLSSRRFHSLCTSRSCALPKRRSPYHNSYSPKAWLPSNACSEFWSPLRPFSVTLFTKNVKIFLRNIVNGSVNSCNFQTMVEIPFQQRHVQQDLLGWKGANQFSLVVHGFAFAVRQVVFYVLRYSLAGKGFVLKQWRHFVHNSLGTSMSA